MDEIYRKVSRKGVKITEKGTFGPTLTLNTYNILCDLESYRMLEGLDDGLMFDAGSGNGCVLAVAKSIFKLNCFGIECDRELMEEADEYFS
ncbi:hypothetical protein, partial [Candidatus Magnetobacterium casense]